MTHDAIKASNRAQLDRLISAFEAADAALKAAQAQWESDSSDAAGQLLEDAVTRYNDAAVQLAIYVKVSFRGGDL